MAVSDWCKAGEAHNVKLGNEFGKYRPMRLSEQGRCAPVPPASTGRRSARWLRVVQKAESASC